MSSKKMKALTFVVAITLIVCLGLGAVLTYALTLVNTNSGFTVQYTGRRDVYATINGASYIDETLDQSLTEVVINGQTSGTQNQSFGSNIALSQGETLKFIFTVANNNTYTTLSNLYVLPTVTLTLPQNNNTELTKTTQFKIGSNEYADYIDSINSCGYITVAKNQTLTIKVTVTLPATADDLTLTGSIALDLRSDRNLPTGYVDRGNAGITLASILANGIGEYPQTRATAEVETALSAGIANGTITANTKTWTVMMESSSETYAFDTINLPEYTYTATGDRYVKVEDVYNEDSGEYEDQFFKVEPIELMEVNTNNEIASYSGKHVLTTKKVITGSGVINYGDEWSYAWSQSPARSFMNGYFGQESGLLDIAESITIQNNSGNEGTYDSTNEVWQDGSGTSTTDKLWACSADEFNAWSNTTHFNFDIDTENDDESTIVHKTFSDFSAVFVGEYNYYALRTGIEETPDNEPMGFCYVSGDSIGQSDGGSGAVIYGCRPFFALDI